MAIVQETFTDEERRLMIEVILNKQLRSPDPRLVKILSRLNGTDTRIVAHRAYPSRDVYPVMESPA